MRKKCFPETMWPFVDSVVRYAIYLADHNTITLEHKKIYLKKKMKNKIKENYVLLVLDTKKKPIINGFDRLTFITDEITKRVKKSQRYIRIKSFIDQRKTKNSEL